MTKREEVELSLEAEFGTYVWSDLGGPTRDALISREMRVRELEATLASIVECQVEDVDGCGACVDAARLALNSKGEKK